jgi:hypothetical protein
MVCLMARKTFAPFVHAQTCARVRFQIEIYWAGKRTKASGWHGGLASLALIIHPFRKSNEMQNSIARNTTTTTVKQQTVFQVSYSTVVPIIASNHYHNH